MNGRYATLLLLLGSLSLVAGAVWAQDWSELSARQQQQLADFRTIWPQLSDTRQTRLVRNAEHIARMSPANRQKLVDSMTQTTVPAEDADSSSP